MYCTNYSRTDQSKVKIPIILAESLSCHPSSSCPCEYAIQTIVALSKSTKYAFDQSQSDHSGAQEDGDCEVLRIQAFFPFSWAFDDGLEGAYQLHYSRDDESVLKIFDGLLESRNDASAAVCAERSLRVQQLFEEVHWIQRQEIIMLVIYLNSILKSRISLRQNRNPQAINEEYWPYYN